MEKNYLPIGSVVLLKGAKKKLMITGFYIKAEGFDNIFDYSGCLYPEGIVTSDQNGVFNHDQIDQVIFKGYESEEETEFKQRLYEAIAKDEAGSGEAAPLQPTNTVVPTVGEETPVKEEATQVPVTETPVVETAPVETQPPVENVAPVETPAPVTETPVAPAPVQEVEPTLVNPLETATAQPPIENVAPVETAPVTETPVAPTPDVVPPAQPSVFEVNENA